MTPTREEFLHIGQGKPIFYILTFLSLGIMAWQIVGRIRVWMQGRPIGGEPAKGIRYWIPTRTQAVKWLSNIWSYVLLQRKVRTSRRRSGAPMHLLLFYGFLSMLLATTILAINTYGPWKFHQGAFYLGYEFAFDVLGLMLVVGCLWALMRRVRAGKSPSAPQTTAPSDYGVLALLLAIGVTGYLLEAARLGNYAYHDALEDWNRASIVGFALAKLVGPVSDGGYVVIWWVHAALIMAMFVTLPRWRLRHIVMAVMSTAGQPEREMGHLAPISMEEVERTEKIGVSVPADYSRWHLMSLDACMECGRCTEVCPAHGAGKILNPKRIVQDIRGAMVPNSPVASAVSEEALWACTTCNACVEACPVLIRHVDLIVDARRNLVAEGALAGTGATMLRQLGSTGHAWGQPANEREKWMEGLEIPLCRDGAEFEFLFWVGCAGATDPGAIKTTKAVAELLTKAGVKFACLGREEACTGDPARRVGEEFLFQDKAAQNVSVFERYGVKKVVTACPHCFNSLKNEYGDFGARLEVFHHTQLFQQLISKGSLVSAKPGRGEVAIHDPCYLGRINNEADAPRALLGIEPRLNELGHVPGNPEEPAHYGRKTLCCGAGGGRMWMEEAPEQRPSNRRAEELVATGAKTIALGCPFCRIMLDAAVPQVTDESIRLVDLAELLQEVNAAP